MRDCALTVAILSSAPHNLIDAQRTAIRGQSSGGYTVLAVLCAFPDAFAAGTSHFGISDLKKLDEFTHKFESRYCETLLGGTVQEKGEVYAERSPVNNADKIKSPLLVSYMLEMLRLSCADYYCACRFCRDQKTKSSRPSRQSSSCVPSGSATAKSSTSSSRAKGTVGARQRTSSVRSRKSLSSTRVYLG